jgi:hypothetical protein
VTATGRAPRMVGNGDGVGRLMVVIGCRERHETGGRDEERSSRSGLVGTRKESESVWDAHALERAGRN